ncbi:MAG: Nif3-like dinuclear metal center hexameric protein [Bacilli bacterium]|nr:Nif3-like dinuclear metal center hexameric protein [Bacilli bacterium]
MSIKRFEEVALSFFQKETLDFFNDGIQFGFNNYQNKNIKQIGYSVNLTPDIIKQAIEKRVDLILTHHNIWEDHFEMREECLKLLEDNNLTHFFNHLPLDASNFGPSYALAERLEVEVTDRISFYEGFYFGVVGNIQPLTLDEFTIKLEDVLGHKVRVWKNNNEVIKRVGIVSGSGKDLINLHEAKTLGCEAYITGEKSLTTLLYARHIGLNFLLGSHTFTEIDGMRKYAQLINEKMPEVNFFELKEEWIE